MAFRIGNAAIRGEIDNRLRGRVMGRIWLNGRERPIRLNLHGNCRRDIAGHRITFECHPTESLHHGDMLNELQEGETGDMTASRRVDTWDIPYDEVRERRQRGEDVPVKKSNCLYLEWFSKANGRVVLETASFQVASMSKPEWRMDAQQDREQATRTAEAMDSFIHQIESARGNGDKPWSPEDDKPMDEFEWERELRASDARTDQYGELLEKYDGHPDAERLVAREMGWDRLEDLLDADASGAFDADRALQDADLPPLEPNPLTEGTDWIRTADDDVRHPLAHRSATVALTIWRACDERGLLADDRNEQAADMAFQAQLLSAKLAGALNGLAYREEQDGGFVVACLKRALKIFDATGAALQSVRQDETIEADTIDGWQRELFEIRQEMLSLMKRYRES